MRIYTCKNCGKNNIKKNNQAQPNVKFCDRKCYFEYKKKIPSRPRNKFHIFNGYRYVWNPKHPNAVKGKRYMQESRLVVEKKMGRYLEKNEIIHHINGNKLDNRIENLELTTRSKHIKDHKKLFPRDNFGRFIKQ